MRFRVEVGELEKHVVEYSFNQLRGQVQIRVDEQTIHQAKRIINEPVHEVFHFVVGEQERSEVRIEKHRWPLLGHRNCVYVDNRLTNVFRGL